MPMERDDRRFRSARPGDAQGVLEIYGPIVRDTAISFEFAVPTVEEIARRIDSTLPRFPWIVCEDASGLIGYASASTFRTRAAYDWSVESSVYVAPRAHRHGVARALYERLVAILAHQGFRIVIGGIALPNEASVALHESMGFVLNGVLPKIGRKFDRWWDLGLWRLDLPPTPDDGRAPLPFAAIAADVDQALVAGRLKI